MKTVLKRFPLAAISIFLSDEMRKPNRIPPTATSWNIPRKPEPNTETPTRQKSNGQQGSKTARLNKGDPRRDLGPAFNIPRAPRMACTASTRGRLPQKDLREPSGGGQPRIKRATDRVNQRPSSAMHMPPRNASASLKIQRGPQGEPPPRASPGACGARIRKAPSASATPCPPAASRCSTLGEGGLNCRVRDGTG